jgi:cytosine/uracil/thiamine/allantoin permease
MEVPAVFGEIYNYAWFASFGAAFLFYVVTMKVVGRKWAA